MPPFKEDQILIISPGSHNTLVQLGLPESFTPAQLRVKSRMFPAEKDGEWEPCKIRAKPKPVTSESTAAPDRTSDERDDPDLYEDWETDDGAVWPIVDGQITDWSCFYALMNYAYNKASPHMQIQTPILCIAQPCWSEKDHEQITQFFFEKFRCPAFSLIDAATAALYGFNVESACVIDVGFSKADITAITGFEINRIGRTVSLRDCGGEVMTQTLLSHLKSKDFTHEMCEQLKKTHICEILPPGVSVPGSDGLTSEPIAKSTTVAGTGASGTGPPSSSGLGVAGNAQSGVGVDAFVADEDGAAGDNEGVLDVASIVTGGEKKMEEFLAKKEREKAEKAARKRSGAAADGKNKDGLKDGRLANAKRETATFVYTDHTGGETTQNPVHEHGLATQPDSEHNHGAQAVPGQQEDPMRVDLAASTETNGTPRQTVAQKREVQVGVERFHAVSDGQLERLADAIYRTISAVNVGKRSDVWESLILVGNGSKVRGFREALIALLQKKYLISPSSATMFTSEIPSTISTPAGTGSQTPQPQLGGPPQGSGVNPLLLAATTASNPHLQQGGLPQSQQQNLHSSHGQTPTSVKWAKPMEYFPEWKDHGYDEAQFLGAQVAAKIFFISPPGDCKTYMSRTDYNELGPSGVHQIYL